MSIYRYRYTHMYKGRNGWSMWYTLIQYEQRLDQDFIHRLMHDLADTCMYIYIYMHIEIGIQIYVHICIYVYIINMCYIILYTDSHRSSAFRYMCEYMHIYIYIYIKRYTYIYIHKCVCTSYREVTCHLSLVIASRCLRDCWQRPPDVCLTQRPTRPR